MASQGDWERDKTMTVPRREQDWTGSSGSHHSNACGPREPQAALGVRVSGIHDAAPVECVLVSRMSSSHTRLGVSP